MPRQWGIPPKQDDAFDRARRIRPLATLAVTAIFGIFGAALSTLSFVGARATASDVFHGWSLVAAIVAGGFGCWAYIWIARPRFAAHFTGGDGFSALIKFYARAAFALAVLFAIAQALLIGKSETFSALLFCITGGAAAAAAFQTVLAFVPAYQNDAASQ